MMVVFITGASSGIGAALAREYSRRGATVVVTGRRMERLTALASELEDQGGRALALAVDVTDESGLRAAIAETLRVLGRLDRLVANAGFLVSGPFAELSNDDYRRQFETNVFGVLNTVRAGLPALQESGGRLVVLGSISGYASMPERSPYAMSKFAVRAFAEGVRPELARQGVGLTLVSPGFVESEIRLGPDGRDPIPGFLQMSAARAARQIIAAVEKGRDEVVITWHGKLVVFLFSHFPGLMRWAIRLRQ